MPLYPSSGESSWRPPEATRQKETYDEDAARRAVDPICKEICVTLGDKLTSGEREYSFTKGDTETTVVFAPRVFTEKLKAEDIKHIFAYNKKSGLQSSITIDTETHIPTDVKQSGLHHTLEIKREYGGSYSVREWQSTPLTKETKVGKPLRGGNLGTEITYAKERGLRLCVGTYQEPKRFEKWRQQWQERLGIGKDQDIEPENERIVYEREKDNKFRLVSGNKTWVFLDQNGVKVSRPRIEDRRCVFEIAARESGGLNINRRVPLETPSINRLISEAKSVEIAARIS